MQKHRPVNLIPEPSATDSLTGCFKKKWQLKSIPTRRHITGAVHFHFLRQVQKCPRGVLYTQRDSLPFHSWKCMWAGGRRREVAAICSLSWEIIVKWVSLFADVHCWNLSVDNKWGSTAGGETGCLAFLTSKNNNAVTRRRTTAQLETYSGQKQLLCFTCTQNINSDHYKLNAS